METLPVDGWVVNVIDHFLPRQLMANLEKKPQIATVES